MPQSARVRPHTPVLCTAAPPSESTSASAAQEVYTAPSTPEAYIIPPTPDNSLILESVPSSPDRPGNGSVEESRMPFRFCNYIPPDELARYERDCEEMELVLSSSSESDI